MEETEITQEQKDKVELINSTFIKVLEVLQVNNIIGDDFKTDPRIVLALNDLAEAKEAIIHKILN